MTQNTPGWLADCFKFKSPLRQYLQSISCHPPSTWRKKRWIDGRNNSNNPHLAPAACTNDPYPYNVGCPGTANLALLPNPITSVLPFNQFTLNFTCLQTEVINQ